MLSGSMTRSLPSTGRASRPIFPAIARAITPFFDMSIIGCFCALLLGGCSETPAGRDAGITLIDRSVFDGVTIADRGPLPDNSAFDSNGRPDSRADSRPPIDSARRDVAPPRDTRPPPADFAPGGLIPPRGGSSAGSGGQTAPSGTTVSVSGVQYIAIVPNSYRASSKAALMIVFSGTEGASQMAANLSGAGPSLGLGDVLFAVLDGPATSVQRPGGRHGARPYAEALQYRQRSHIFCRSRPVRALGCSSASTSDRAISPPIGQTTSPPAPPPKRRPRSSASRLGEMPGRVANFKPRRRSSTA